MTLFWVSAAAGGELQWRAPNLPGTAAAKRTEAVAHREKPALPRDSAAVNRLRTVQPVAHEERAAGPELIPAGDDQQEPRKLRSVLVRRSATVRPITDQPEQGSSPRGERTVRDGNVLRAAQTQNQAGGASATWRFPTRDPFEDNPEWRKSAGSAASHPVQRTAQRDAGERSTRSVLVRDPFEDSAGGAEQGYSDRRGHYVSQPQTVNGQPLTGQEEGIEGFGRFTEDPIFGQPAQDRSLEAERDRAEESCRQALETLDRRRIRSGRDELSIRVPGAEGVDVPFECALDHKSYQPRVWGDMTYMWKASALCHKPLYFEDVHLERYGHSWGWHVQPLVSAAHFFTTLPILPYKMGLEPPNECIYALGYYRPGNCAPYLIEPLGTSPRAVVWQAGAIVGATAIIP